MLIFEFENGSIVNLLTFESLTIINNVHYLNTISGKTYEITLDEFNAIKTIIRDSLKENTENNK